MTSVLVRSSPSDTGHAFSPDYTRLHITPLDTDLLPVLLSSSVLPLARNVSFHTLATFPEKRYGFIELPADDAEQLKRKLNGAVVKGLKLRVEKARPDRLRAPMGDAALARDAGDAKVRKEKTHKVKKDKSKKRKRHGDDMIGVELEEGRKVKRGWTVTPEDVKTKNEEKGKEKRAKKEKPAKEDGDEERKKKTPKASKEIKSKYTDQPECLVKTILPPNVAAERSRSGKKGKKEKSREMVVHEFENTTKFPSFLKRVEPSAKRKAAVEYVDGKGWVDEDGNVVEAVKPRGPVGQRRERMPTPQNDLYDGAVAKEHAETYLTPATPSSPAIAPTRPMSSGSMNRLSLKMPPSTPAMAKVHPLEALYRRAADDGTRKTPKPFSFFGQDDQDGEVAPPGIQVPLTPFSHLDYEQRGIRSAAPTPDTAHPYRSRPWSPDQEEDIEEGDEMEVDDKKDEPPVSSFATWFYENKRELGKAWRLRRKTAAKEKRYRDNRARAERAI